jgi:hypothetical protein
MPFAMPFACCSRPDAREDYDTLDLLGTGTRPAADASGPTSRTRSESTAEFQPVSALMALNNGNAESALQLEVERLRARVMELEGQSTGQRGALNTVLASVTPSLSKKSERAINAASAWLLEQREGL